MLVGAFQVQVHRRLKIRPHRRHAVERQPGVGPHIHHIRELLVLLGLRAEQFARLQREPGVDATALDARGHLLQQLLGARMQRAGVLCTNSASGTPQVRCREMHQSGRSAIMPVMRCSPQEGVQLHLADVAQRMRAQILAGPC